MTVEAAVALATLAVVTATALGSVATVTASVRCIDAARELVRLAARGEPERARSVATGLAPSGAMIELTVSGDELHAEVSAVPVRLVPLRVSGRATGVLEPGVRTGRGLS
ncbi:TadE family type IV pilus minor pilin [Pseudonocardia asaccharolytica]|uniref:TadE family type IV pilus minor pilin n=1 Tax=Pseudonocardia asaccharolytica TaxID=54010 RepID=UPI0003FC391F|nr:TadE family type IV pilus minor pilin [Pseudonocardia asaccharolytica]